MTSTPARLTRDTTDGANTATGLRVDGVRRYGIGPVSFTAEPGTFVVVTGGDQTGKSAILGVVAGFDRPDSGRGSMLVWPLSLTCAVHERPLQSRRR